ncbi:MAG: DUF4149 domain-containing protein [Pseudomonadota bacterium]
MDAGFAAHIALFTSLFFTALTVGAMAYFGAGVAPVVFRTLGEEKAGPVVRAMFPVYYLVLGITTLLAAIPAFLVNVAAGIVLIVVAGGFAFARQIMMPRINALRDEMNRGSTVATSAFDALHSWSVRMNMLQLIILLIVFWFLALSVG